MKKVRLLSLISVTVSSCTLVGIVVQAGPVRPTLKSIVYKMVGGNQVRPYDLSSRQRRLTRSPSPSSITQDDGQQPSTSAVAISSASVRHSTSTSSSTPSLLERVDTGSLQLIRRDISKIITWTSPDTGEIKTRRNGKPNDLVLGEAIYKMTHNRDGKELRDVGPRPHVVVHTEPSKIRSGYTEVYIATMTKAVGKEKRLTDPHYLLLDTRNPNFSGRSATFINLTSLTKLTLENSKRQKLLGKVITDEDLKFLRQRFGFEN